MYRVLKGGLEAFFGYVACNQWYNPRGITAINPRDYATRFEEFFSAHVLGLAYKPANGKTWQPFW